MRLIDSSGWLEGTEGAKFWLKILTELKNRGMQLVGGWIDEKQTKTTSHQSFRRSIPR